MSDELEYLKRLSVTNFSGKVSDLSDSSTIRLIRKKILSMNLGDEEKKLATNVLDNTIQSVIVDDGDDAFVITGDIPAMWLRDSTCQLKPFIKYLTEDDEQLRNIIKR